MSKSGLEGMFGQLMGGREDGQGLEHLLGKLRQQGLGGEVDSWVSTGPNRAVAPEQIQAAFGQDQLSGMAQQFGMPSGALGGILAQLLPELVNRLTPNGQVPQQLPGGMGGLGGIAASILGGLLANGGGQGGGQGGGGRWPGQHSGRAARWWPGGGRADAARCADAARRANGTRRAAR